MKLAFNPSTVAALIAPPNNKDITFDLRGHNIFARGVKFCGTDTWRDIKINNVSIGSNILDLQNGSNTTLTNTNGVVTINSTWRPVVDNLTSDSTTSSLSANLGRVLAGLIDGKSDSDHIHDDRYVKKSGDTMLGALNFANGTWNLVGDDSYLGDCNISGHFGIKAANTTYPGIAFFNNANAHLGNLTAYSGNIKYGAYSLQFLDNGNTSVGASTWTNPFSGYNSNAVADGQAICVWGQSSSLSNLAADSGDMSLWLKRVNAKAATLNMVLDGEYYANGNLRLAHVSEIPNSLKNPYSLTTFGVVYDGSAAKTVTTSTFISLVTEGTSTVTDGTMLITSYASNSGFADTNAVNVPYKRKAIHLWDYIKAKTDSLYAVIGHNHDDRYLKLTGGVLKGQIILPDIDVNTSYTGSIIIGASNTENLGIDGNEIMARNNGKASTLYLNNDGGAVQLGAILRTNSNIAYIGSRSTQSMIKFINNTSDPYGNGIAIGGGGLTIIGSGESSDVVMGLHSSGGDENMIIAGDNNIDFYSNLQDGWEYGKHMYLDKNGFLFTPSYINIGGNENNNSSPDRVWGSNSSDSYLRSYRTSALRVAHANTSGLSWNVPILGQHWSRLFAGIPNVMHHSSIFSISGSINCVVFCLTFLVESSHAGSATIICLFSGSYTQPKMRALAKSDGTVLVDLFWSGNDCSLSSSTQQMTINIIANVLLGSISPITSLTNDDTIPSGYSNTCEFLCASKTSNFYNVSLHTLGVNNIATFNINNQWLTPSVLQIGRIDGSQNESKAVIGVTNGNLYIDAYHNKELYLNYYNKGRIRLGYQTGSYYISEDGSYYNGTAASASNADKLDGIHANELLTELSNTNNGISVTVGGTTKSVANISVNYASSAGNADTVDGEHASSFVRAGHYESADLNNLDTYSFIRSVNSNNKDTSPKGNTGWYNVILAVHRNGNVDGPGYIGQIALGMTTNTDDMFFRGRRTDSWKTVIHSGNISSQTVANAYHLYINSVNSWSTWHWVGLGSLPSWLWGSNDGTNMYVWSPSNFRVAYATSAGNADTVDGYHATMGSNNPWGTIPVIHTSGWMDIGKQLEFHFDNTTGSDYSTVLRCTGNYSNNVHLPSASGTLALTSDNVASATKLQTARKIWGLNFDGTKDINGLLTHIISSDDLFLNVHDNRTSSGYLAIRYFRNGADVAALHWFHDKFGGCNWNSNCLNLDTYRGGYVTLGRWDNPDLTVVREGNVGIGITSPSYKLEVNGTLGVTSTASFGSTMYLPSIGTSYIDKGSEDKSGADFTEANIVIKSWWGISIKSYDDVVRTYIDTRTGNIGTKGKFIGNLNGTADSANKLNKWFDSRVTTLNHLFGDGALRIFHATSSVTDTTKCPSDATILHLAWDSNGGWDSQLAVSNNLARVYSRSQNRGTWQPWKTLAFTTDIPLSLKNPHALTLKANGTTLATYDGSYAKEVNFTYTNIGAASASHNHDNVYLKLAGGTMLDLSRISVNGDLYIGDAGNGGWLYFQDIASLDGTDYWSISTNGSAGFEDISTRSNVNVGGLIYRDGISSHWNKGRDNALLRDTSSSGYHVLWSLKTTNGSWDFGEYNNSGWNNIPVLSYITDSNYNSENYTYTHQIKFPLASGTVALTSNIPNPTDYYWADVKVSSSPSTTTFPTFLNLTITNKILRRHENYFFALPFFAAYGLINLSTLTFEGNVACTVTKIANNHFKISFDILDDIFRYLIFLTPIYASGYVEVYYYLSDCRTLDYGLYPSSTFINIVNVMLINFRDHVK